MKPIGPAGTLVSRMGMHGSKEILGHAATAKNANERPVTNNKKETA
jgi:hypothetical protein